MSHAVVRGPPTAAQLAFDSLLDEVVLAQAEVPGAEARARLSLPQVLFHCLKAHPEDLFMINADTDEKTTNQQLLLQAVSLARTFLARGVKGKVVVLLHDTHRTMIAVYFAVMFAGAVPYVMFNENTALETASFLELLQPVLVTCDTRYRSLVTSALVQLQSLNPELLLDLEGSAEEADVNSFQLPEVDPDDTVIMLGTSGTTGLPKSVELTHRGFVARMSWSLKPTKAVNLWVVRGREGTPRDVVLSLRTPVNDMVVLAHMYFFMHFGSLHFIFPSSARPRSAEYPVDRALLPFSSDGLAFLRYMTNCLANRVELLLPQTLPSAEGLRDMLLKYRPTMLMMTPLSASALLPLTTADHFSTLRMLFLAGASTSKKLIADIKEKVPSSALLCNIYGATEVQGGTAEGPAGEHLRFSNCIHYKVVDDSGNEVGNGETGELYIKSPTLAKGYYKRPQHEFFENGWFKTGDLFLKDGEGNLWYLDRKGICFKFMGAHVSPAETEQVIESIEGVVCCMVTATERGSAAAVVAGSDVTREMVHAAVKASLSKNKWLYGGVAFVPSLPKTGMGKIQRQACKAILQKMFETGECY